MNERIKELAISAGLSEFISMLDRHELGQELDKFAKLIIKEVADICSELQAEYDKTRKNEIDFNEKNIYAEGSAACHSIKLRMQRKFGVKINDTN